jgi:nucleolar protein 53
LAEKAFRKRLLESVNSAKNIWRTAKQTVAAREQAREERQRALNEKLAKMGLAGKKLGRHRVPEGEVDVQLGEELSENLRGLKV